MQLGNWQPRSFVVQPAIPRDLLGTSLDNLNGALRRAWELAKKHRVRVDILEVDDDGTCRPSLTISPDALPRWLTQFIETERGTPIG